MSRAAQGLTDSCPNFCASSGPATDAAATPPKGSGGIGAAREQRPAGIGPERGSAARGARTA